ISSWDVSSVTNMDDMFKNALAFNQNLSFWCVTNITSEPTDFSTGATNWLLGRPIWGTCPEPYNPNHMILLVDTSKGNGNNQVDLPLYDTVTNVTVYWG